MQQVHGNLTAAIVYAELSKAVNLIVHRSATQITTDHICFRLRLAGATSQARPEDAVTNR